MPLFPEIDVSGYAQADVQPLHSRAAHTDPMGVMPGLNASLLAFLANFDPGTFGVCVVDNNLQLSLAVPHWAEHAIVNSPVVTVAGGVGTNALVYTVPSDRRLMLYHLNAPRSGGDGKLDNINCVSPTGYFEIDDQISLVAYSAAANEGFWPDPGAVQANIRSYVGISPLLLEPGTRLRLGTSGAGSSETSWSCDIYGLLTPLMRSIGPGLS